MDRRTKILAGVFGAVVGYALLAGVAYPRWVRPLLMLDERIAARQEDLDALLVEDEAVQKARFEYKALAARIGSFDPGRVETDIRDQLNQLIKRHNLADAGVTPSRPVPDRKTGLFTSSITVSANGTVESAVAFLKDVAELPHLTRIGNASMSPAGGGRKDVSKDHRVTFRVPLETWVLPQHPVVQRINVEELDHPASHVRHQGRDYTAIAAAKPFWEWVPPIPLVARIARPINVEVGQPAPLEGIVSGGDGEYTIEWSPAEGLSDPKNLRPTVDTSKAGNRTYTLSVTDGTGNTVTSSTSVTVREPKPIEPVVVKTVEPPPPPPPPPVPVRKRWPEGRTKEIKMALLSNMGGERHHEFLVFNSKSRQNEYYKVGQEFDGGTLEFVHPYGGVVRWNEEYFLYPLGSNLDQFVDARAAAEYPELLVAVEKLRAARVKPAPARPNKTEAPAPAGGSAEGEKPSVEAPADGGLGTPSIVPPARAITAGDLPTGSVAAAELAPEKVAAEIQMVPLVFEPLPLAAHQEGMGPPGPPGDAGKGTPVRPRPKMPRPVVKSRP